MAACWLAVACRSFHNPVLHIRHETTGGNRVVRAGSGGIRAFAPARGLGPSARHPSQTLRCYRLIIIVLFHNGLASDRRSARG